MAAALSAAEGGKASGRIMAPSLMMTAFSTQGFNSRTFPTQRREVRQSAVAAAKVRPV